MMNSAEFGIELDKDNNYRNKMWYFVFNNGSHPFVLTEKDFNMLISSDMLFARKFDADSDRKILDMLDSEVHKI